MKTLFLVKYYDPFVDALSKKLKAEEEMNFNGSMDFVIRESASILSPFIPTLRREGLEAEMIIPNFEVIQHKWAAENNIPFDSDWMFTVAKEQIKKSKPDILFMNSNFEFYDDFLEEVRPFVGKICAWISCPFDDSLVLEHIDHIFTLFEPHHIHFKKIGKASTLTQASFDADVLPRLQKKESIDLSFVGGIGGYHHEREKALRYLVKRTPLKIWGYGFNSANRLKNALKQTKQGFVFNKAHQGEAWGLDMLEILYNSKITFNVHGDISMGHAVNMRMFEATGVGTLLLTEHSPRLQDFFEPDKEVVTYKSYAEAVDKIKYYLQHEEERLKIAAAGQARTLKDHTFQKTIKVFTEIFQSLSDNYAQ